MTSDTRHQNENSSVTTKHNLTIYHRKDHMEHPHEDDAAVSLRKSIAISLPSG
jgi:hypothetical protein